MHAADRVELLGPGRSDPNLVGMGKSQDNPPDYFSSELPDIDAEEDLKAIKNRDQEIVIMIKQDNDVKDLGVGVQKLRDIAIDMGQVIIINQELDQQIEDLDRIDRKVETALDHVDNINVSLKKAVDGVMKGDKFMVNCILLCVILALAAYVSTQFFDPGS